MKALNQNVLRRSLIFGVAIYLVCITCVFAQTSVSSKSLVKAQTEYDNGNYTVALALAESEFEKAKEANKVNLELSSLIIISNSQISLQRYADAEKNLGTALKITSENSIESREKAEIYLCYAFLWRSQRKMDKAFEFGKKALDTVPDNREVLGEYYLNIGRVLFSEGYDVSAIIWLEKAEQIFEAAKVSSGKLDTYRFLSLAWGSKLNNQKALFYAEKRVALSEATAFKHNHRQALYELGALLSATGQTQNAFSAFKRALSLALSEKNTYQARMNLTSLFLNCLNENDSTEAANYVAQLEKLDNDGEFEFEATLGKAILAAFKGDFNHSEKLFADADRMKKYSPYIIPLWRIKIAERQNDWERVIQLNQSVFDLTVKDNFRDDLPNLYFSFANAYHHLGQTQKALKNLEQALAIIEDIRQTKSPQLSLGLLEVHHKAYRLLTEIKSKDARDLFEWTDFMKARLLKDKINNAAIKNSPEIPASTREKLEELSLKFIEDQRYGEEIDKNEKLFTTAIPELKLGKPNLSGLEKLPDLDNSTIISYFFTLDKKLMATVWEKGKPVRMVSLSISEDEVSKAAVKTRQNIKNRIFFKRDGKDLFDKLLKPLAVTSKHLIIVPDKSLWNIPFQALSSDGEKYLIEEKVISYVPAVSVLLEQIQNSRPERRTIRAFANSGFENKNLRFVNSEASAVSKIYNSVPAINATENNFKEMTEKPDILHFSMHAEIDSAQPLNSFLGFRRTAESDGRLNVEEILGIQIKKGSLVFLASCDTNNVLNGEGVVSLAWAMMASGATTVVSSQWEANDKSTAVFTSNFYINYKQGSSAAEAMQKVALELIKNKASGLHEPYYWADFMLNGDFR